MIKSIELWDFESHEHTLIDDISPGFNLFCGESNSGKTSLLARSLKLVAYNQFDPKSVRIGAKKCVVEVKTERGTVKVTRGSKDNLWEITKTGQPTQFFDKVGVNIVPEAADILGLNIVTLGDVEIPVNIMDQLESHFMLSGIGNKDASGSMRAQIVDEISGLSGIEGLIKDVSLDHHRFGREITETEKKMEETRKQLHPESDLHSEEQLLSKAEKEWKDSCEMEGLANESSQIYEKWIQLSQKEDELNLQLAAIPDTQVALIEINRADDLLTRSTSAEKLNSAYNTAKGRLAILKKQLLGIPDFAKAVVLLAEEEAKIRILAKSEEVLKSWQTATSSLASKQTRAKQVTDALKARDELAKADKSLTLCTQAEALLTTLQSLWSKQTGLKIRFQTNEQKLSDAIKERDSILSSVTMCPLTLKPVSKGCLEGAKT